MKVIKNPIVVTITIVLIFASPYFIRFHWGISESASDFGSFGDYFVGTFGAIISAFALYFAYNAFKLQKVDIYLKNISKNDEEIEKVLNTSGPNGRSLVSQIHSFLKKNDKSKWEDNFFLLSAIEYEESQSTEKKDAISEFRKNGEFFYWKVSSSLGQIEKNLIRLGQLDRDFEKEQKEIFETKYSFLRKFLAQYLAERTEAAELAKSLNNLTQKEK